MRRFRFTSLSGARSYYLHLPRGVRRTTRVPLVVALHGCDQTALDFAAGTRLNEVADRHGFAVVYPEQSLLANGQRCWSWYRSDHQVRGRGEPAIIAGLVQRLTAERSRWRIDPTRVFVTGISAGGGMAMVLAATYPELFAAIGVHSAPPYRATTRSSQAVAAMQGRVLPPPPPPGRTAMPPLIVFQGTWDFTVRKVNATRLAEQWQAWFDGPLSAVKVRKILPAQPFSGTGRRGYSVSQWTSSRRRVLEVWQVDGLGHAWSGGASEGGYCDPRGPRASTEMWRFFSKHALPARAARRAA